MHVVLLVGSPCSSKPTVLSTGLWDPRASPAVPRATRDSGKGIGPDADGARQLMSFVEDSAFPDYGAGEGDFRN